MLNNYLLISVAGWPKTSVYDQSLAVIESSASALNMEVCLLWLLCVCQVEVSATPITRPEESCQLWCVIVCDRKTSTNAAALDRVGGGGEREREREAK
jgi:hypothetical protein